MTVENEVGNVYLEKALKYYMTHRPYFYAFVRPQELQMFHEVSALFQRPILDFGCGDGFFSAFLSELAPIEFGVDRESSILPEARKVYNEVILSDKISIPIPAESVRTIFSNSVFEHLHQPERMLPELARILQPGGRLYTTITTKAWEESLMGIKWFGRPYRQWFRKVQRHDRLFDYHEWREMFEKAGFRIVKVTGYLDANAVKAIEAYHYLAWPTFFSKALFGRWDHPLTRVTNSVLARFSQKVELKMPADIASAPCHFFIVEKPDS